MTKTVHYGFDRDDVAGDALTGIDAELYRQATHHHTGVQAGVPSPVDAPVLSLSPLTGRLTPSRRYFYRLTWVDGFGHESGPSPQAHFDTPDPLAEPAAPAVVTEASGGTLASGDYLYVLSAYSPDANRETLALNPAVVTAAAGSTNRNIITLPPKPSGATGFNLYRRVPSGTGYFLLATIPMDMATPPTTYVDDGSMGADAERTLPAANTTNMDLSIDVALGAADSPAPPSYLWRIYRTATPDNWSASLLHTVDLAADVAYVDKGSATIAGAPPTQAGIDNPDKVQLTNAAEVQGRLPMGRTTFPFTAAFEFPGDVAIGPGLAEWICEYPAATIIGVRVCTGRGLVPFGTVVADVLKGWAGATPSYASIFSDPAHRPFLLAGYSNGGRHTPDTRELALGDTLVADIVSIDGATPQARYVTVWVYGIAHGFPDSVSFVDGTSTGV